MLGMVDDCLTSADKIHVKKRKRSLRSNEACMELLDDLHPDATWCGAQVLTDVCKSVDVTSLRLKVEANGKDLKSIVPIVFDPEEMLQESDIWTVAHNPAPEHTIDLHSAADPEVLLAKEANALAQKIAKDEKQKVKVAQKAANKEAKKAVRVAKPRPKRRKNNQEKKQKVLEGFPDYYPPVGYRLEFEANGDWFEGEFTRMEADEDGDELCHIFDHESKLTHRILLREIDEHKEWIDCVDWHPLWSCNVCDRFTGGKYECEMCFKEKDVDLD
jgi:hypothetical protein